MNTKDIENTEQSKLLVHTTEKLVESLLVDLRVVAKSVIGELKM